MSAPQWLCEFHRQWQAARGGRVGPSVRGFVRDWAKLLADAGVERAEDQATAVREVEAMERAGHFVLKRHRYRKYLLEKIELPPEGEKWLRGIFGKPSAADLQAASLEWVEECARRKHRRFPQEWAAMCAALRGGFGEGRSLRPFMWRDPAGVRFLLETIHALSAREWEPGTPIRAASVEIGLDSKVLERRRRSVESALGCLFGSATELKSLGLVAGDSMVELSGPLCLHFADGTTQTYDGVTHANISATDLARCLRITTTAERLLTIENRKTTFRQFALANRDRRTLLAASSFPTEVFRDLLDKLPADLEHWHFGDTDPAGWHILLKLREVSPRPVAAFRMAWRAAGELRPLTPYDRALLPRLLTSPLLADVREEIARIEVLGDRGDYEQETLGPPEGDGWPFGGTGRMPLP
jgi:hypothetical protein